MMSTATSSHCRLGELMGRTVRLPSGEEIGRVEDFIVRLENHSLCYAAISLAEASPNQRRWVAVPCQALTLRREDNQVFFVLHLQREELQDLPAFDPREWSSAVSKWTGSLAQLFREEGRMDSKSARKKDAELERSAAPNAGDIGSDELVDRLFTGPSGPGGPDKTREF